MIRTLILIAVGYLAIVLGYALFQRKLLYYPTNDDETHGLAVWQHDGLLIGYAREVASPVNVWLMLHGNGGQASDRVYALPRFPASIRCSSLNIPVTAHAPVPRP